jgi:hypothetical protein
MESPKGSPEWLEVFTAAERPDLWERARQEEVLDRVWPEYNHHGNDSPATFRALVPRYADFQMLFTDRRADRIVARGRAIPFRWDGTLADLPAGIDALGPRALSEEGGPPTALSALAAEVDDTLQGSGLSRLVILAMAALARARGLRSLVAPVRPNWKDRYPLIPIDRYAAWTRPDGLPFDPWMRVHARWAPGSCARRRGRCTSPPRSRTGRPGSEWRSRTTGSTFSRTGWLPSPCPVARGTTGNPTSGCSTTRCSWRER